MQVANYLPADYVVKVISVSLIKEILPLLMALILIGRSGTAIAIEIGNMKLNEELAAILKMGIPDRAHGLPPAPPRHGDLVPRARHLREPRGGLRRLLPRRAARVVPITFSIDELVAGVQVGDFRGLGASRCSSSAS